MRENLELEVKSLKEQVKFLQSAVSAMQQESEKKEFSLAKLRRDKEKLHRDKEKLIKDKEKLANSLRREKLSSTSIKNQLENERRHYFEVKESYTHEINEFKRNHSKRSCNILAKKIEEELTTCKSEVKQLKDALRETLEANYNLSIRFLRMKTTKSQFKNRLRKMQEDQTKIAVELDSRISLLNRELNFILNNELKNYICPSNKRYLQIIKQNGNLLHENFCLQIEIERLNEQLNEMHDVLTKYKLNKKLKYYRRKCAHVQEDKNKKVLNEEQLHYPVKTKTTEESLRPKISASNYHNEANQLKSHQENRNAFYNKEKQSRFKIHFQEKKEEKPTTNQKYRKNSEENCIKETNIKNSKMREKADEPKSLIAQPFNKFSFNNKQLTFSEFCVKKKADVISKACDSDGLDLVQVSEVQSKTTIKTGDLSSGDAPEYRRNIVKRPLPIMNFFISNTSFRTQSSPDVLHK